MNGNKFDEVLLPDKNNSVSIYLFYPIIFLLVILISFYYFLSLTFIVGTSMENTIGDGQYAVILRNGYTVDRGDIVTLNAKNGTADGIVLIKRVIGLGGDKILYVSAENGYHVDLYICKSGKKTFELCEENYIKERMNASGFNYALENIVKYAPEETITSIDITAEYESDSPAYKLQREIQAKLFTVPKGSIYFLGDNRNHSSDSRRYGTVKYSDIIGEVISVLDYNSGMEKFMRFMFSYYD